MSILLLVKPIPLTFHQLLLPSDETIGIDLTQIQADCLAFIYFSTQQSLGDYRDFECWLVLHAI